MTDLWCSCSFNLCVCVRPAAAAAAAAAAVCPPTLQLVGPRLSLAAEATCTLRALLAGSPQRAALAADAGLAPLIVQVRVGVFVLWCIGTSAVCWDNLPAHACSHTPPAPPACSRMPSHAVPAPAPTCLSHPIPSHPMLYSACACTCACAIPPAAAVRHQPGARHSSRRRAHPPGQQLPGQHTAPGSPSSVRPNRPLARVCSTQPVTRPRPQEQHRLCCCCQPGRWTSGGGGAGGVGLRPAPLTACCC